MCKWGNQKEVKLCQPHEVTGRTTAMVDTCIADIVQKLNAQGVSYEVRYFQNGKAETVYFYEDEVEPAKVHF